MRPLISTVCLLSVVCTAIAQPLGGGILAGTISALSMGIYLLLEGWACGRNGRIVILAALVVAAATLIWRADALDLLVRAGAAAGAIIGLFTALGFLREAAESSPLVQRCGQLLVRQPPGRRYLALTTGSHVISLVLNFGVIPLLGTMVVKGNTLDAAGGEARIVAIRSQRMLSAMLRGFAMMTVWSPLSVSFAVTMAVVPGLPWQTVLPVQIVLSMILLWLGLILDRRAFPPAAAPSATAASATVASLAANDWKPAWHMGALVGGIVVASVLVAELFRVKLVNGAMMVVPPAALIWLWVQERNALPMLLGFARKLLVRMPGFRDEVAMLGGAMFVGVLATSFLSPERIGAVIEHLGLPPLLLVIVLSWLVMALAQIGISQIVTTTLLGGALVHVVPPLVLVSGLMGGWALSACSTPVGAAVLTVARIGNVSVTTVARDWNAKFVIAGALVLAVWLAVLDGVVVLLG